jgi:hypothetical protein
MAGYRVRIAQRYPDDGVLVDRAGGGGGPTLLRGAQKALTPIAGDRRVTP